MLRGVGGTHLLQQQARRRVLQLRSLTSTVSVCKEEGKKPLGISYSQLTVGIPKETFPLEKRVAASKAWKCV